MRKPQPWFVGAAMRALGQHVKNTGTPFGAVQLARWSPELAQAPGLARTAIDRLAKHAMVQATEARGRQRSTDPDLRWTLTDKGLTFCQAVAHAPAPGQPAGGTLAARVWALLRIRRQLTSEEALELLADAGADVGRMQRSIAACLSAWAKAAPDVVQLSARRVGGCKRYVLARDIGMQHPPIDGRPLVAVPPIEPVPTRFRNECSEAQA